jgi:hypothetical protein
VQGFAELKDEEIVYRPGMIEALQRRELLRVGAQLSGELGLRFVETDPGAEIAGVYRRQVDALSGRFALIEKSREFTLVPWRPVLDWHIGKSVAGLVRESGISWTIGRERSGPSLS